MGVSNNGTSITYTYNKGTNDWQPGNGSYLVWDKNDLKFQCWYPADGNNSFNKGYIHEDQSNATEIAKSDYMTAEKHLNAIPDSRKLEVALERKTARLIFNIQSFNDQFDASTKVNHIRMASKASTDAGETSIVNIKPLQNGEGGINTTYTVLVIPGKVEGKLYFSTDESTETPFVVKTGTLEAGKSYTYNLIVGKNKVTIGNVTVAEWGTDKIDGGKAEEYIPYVTFTAEKAQKFMMKTNGNYNISGLEYSVNFGDWTTVEANKEVTFGGTNGDLRLRGTNTDGTASALDKYSTITFTDSNVPVACTGDIRTLLDWDNYTTVNTENAMFINLFENCSVLTSAPELPATSLAYNCYYCMFLGCKNLKSAPKLPATTLASFCYHGMFYGCTSLTSAPELKATTLADNCYSSMFVGCTSLEKAPELKATELAISCYASMFRGCTKLSTVTMLAPGDKISEATDYCNDWLYNAGTDETVTSRTLIVTDEAAYTALKNNTDYLPAKWQIGNCTVLDKDGKAITEQ